MKILGIESTAHTFGLGIVDFKKRKVIFDKRIQYKTESSGIVPREVYSFFCNEGWKIINEALKYSFDAICVACGPGIGTSLRFGICVGKYLSKKLNIPIYGVNHCVAHIEVGKFFTGANDPVIVYTSGANTQILVKSECKYKIFGETLDIGLGNLLDMVARDLGIGFPGGPIIEQYAKKSKNYIELPYIVKGSDLTFSGLYTAIKRLIKSNKYKVEDICYSLQETAFSMLCEVSERAVSQTGKKELLLVGGVFANQRLREMFKILAEDYGVDLHICPKEYVGDNGVMIAIAGYELIKKGIKYEVKCNPYWRTDQVLV